MKLINRFAILIMILGFFSCEDEYEPKSTFTDVAYIVNQNSDEFIIEQGEALSFMDLSQGMKTHQWIIEPDNKFLVDGFGSKDSLPLFINPELDTITTDVVAHVLFNNFGKQKVRLYNTFPDSVTLNEENGQGAEYINGEWVFDHSIEVNVFAPLQPAFDIYKGEELLYSFSEESVINEDDTQWDTISIEFGEELRFVDMTTIDRPDYRLWTLDKALGFETSEDSVATYKFTKLDEFVASTFTTARTNSNYPEETVKVKMPVRIIVGPSTAPFNIDGDIEHVSESVLRVYTNGIIETLETEEDNFTVHANNANGFDQDIVVTKASISKTIHNAIDLTLAEGVYDDDDITVAYTKGAITSNDGRTLNGFETTAVPKTTNEVDIDICGFEIGNDDYESAFCDGWYVAKVNDNYARTTNKAFSGVASMRYTSVGGITDLTLKCSDFPTSDTEDEIKPGTYSVSISVYKPSGTTLTTFQTTTKKPDEYVAVLWDITDIPTDQWVTLTKDITYASGIKEKYNIAIKNAFNQGVTGDQELYFDALSFVRNNTRP